MLYGNNVPMQVSIVQELLLEMLKGKVIVRDLLGGQI